MRFCPKCNTRLRLKQVREERGGVSITYLCDNCGYSNKAGKTVMQTTEEELASVAPIKVLGDKESKLTTLPVTKIDCPRCGHNEAMWWFLQTRSGDEPPTQFYRCLKCNHTWRSYS